MIHLHGMHATGCISCCKLDLIPGEGGLHVTLRAYICRNLNLVRLHAGLESNLVTSKVSTRIASARDSHCVSWGLTKTANCYCIRTTIIPLVAGDTAWTADWFILRNLVVDITTFKTTQIWFTATFCDANIFTCSWICKMRFHTNILYDTHNSHMILYHLKDSEHLDSSHQKYGSLYHRSSYHQQLDNLH